MSLFMMLIIFYWVVIFLCVLELFEREKKCFEGLRCFFFDGR